MANYFGNVKGIDLLSSPRGADEGAVFVVTFDLLAQAQVGGTDTIQLGGGGDDQEVAGTQTLAQMIQNRFRSAGGAFTIDWVGGNAFPGLQAGNKLYAQSAATSGGNVTGLKIYNAPSGGAGQNTTSAAWDSAVAIVVGGHFANPQ